MLKEITLIATATLLGFATIGCDVDQTREGRLPNMDVDVSGDPGELPQYDVQGPDVDMQMERRTVEVPEVDVQMTEKEVTVPNVDVDVPNE